jgi:hypothetical protein
MKQLRVVGLTVLTVLGVQALLAAGGAEKRSPREALQAFHDFIGEWRGTGVVKDKKGDFWSETLNWEWQFKGTDAWLKVTFAKSKHFTGGELRYLPAKDRFQMTVQTPAKETLTFEGALQKNRLVLEREDAAKKETQRLIFNLLHSNRFLYRQEVKAEGKPLFRPLYEVGCTKEGVPFVTGDGRPECIVSGGLGTIKVSYKGQTYYVCCGGCRAEFNEDPEKYIREYNAKKKGK